MKHLTRAVLPLLLVMTTGCFGRTGNGMAEAALTGTLLAARLIAIQSSTEYRNRDLEPTTIYVSSTHAPVQAAPKATPAPEPLPPAPPFDAQQVRTALAEVDLSRCREAGAPRGYGHAKVTLNPSGDISKVVIDAPSGLSPAASACVGEAIGATRVPEFNGSLVSVGTTWFVP